MEKLRLVLADDERLIGVAITDGGRDLMLLSDAGKAARFHEEDVRVMGRTAHGVRGIKMREGQRVIALIVVDEQATILTATANGYGQRTSMDSYRPIGRGGQGVRAIIVDERNGKVVAATQVRDDDEILMISNMGTMVRTKASEISVIGRNTKGVRLVNLGDQECLVGVEAIDVATGRCRVVN